MVNSVALAAVVSTVRWLAELPPVPGRQLTTDTRKVRPGDIFFAYPVGQGDGRDYIEVAIEQGAVAVVFEEADFYWNPQWQVPHCGVNNLLWLSGFIAAEYLHHPDAPMLTVAVTGTNGKTSCTQWLASALSFLGTPTSVIGTLGIGLVQKGSIPAFDVTGFTTPDAVQLQQKIALQSELGARAIAIEASSIGLDQGRMNGMHLDVAVMTNVTRDHLDYHGDMSSYEAAKARLFSWAGLGTAVINLEDEFGVRMMQQALANGVAVIGYTTAESGTENKNCLRASVIRNYQGGTSFQLDSPFGSGQIKTRMIGRFNVSNVLAVMATLFASGVVWKDAVHAVEQLCAVPGRMEQLSSPGRALVMVDYAHTPDALEKTLANLSDVAKERQGKLWCVFGCGGDRDPGKRPQMGKVAELADEIIVTSDNPRSEDPAAIMAQIAAGISPQRQFTMETDRAKAILYAIKHAGKNDVVLLAGKGHEAYQEVAGRKLPFSDVEHAQIALADLSSKGVG